MVRSTPVSGALSACGGARDMAPAPANSWTTRHDTTRHCHVPDAGAAPPAREAALSYTCRAASLSGCASGYRAPDPGRIHMSKRPWRDVIAVVALEPGWGTRVAVGQRLVAIYDTPSGLFASAAFCNQGVADFCDGYFDGHVIECLLHQGAFDVSYGRRVAAPATRRMQAFELRVQDGMVQLRIQSWFRRWPAQGSRRRARHSFARRPDRTRPRSASPAPSVRRLP